jgi:hypothetical protein
MKMPEDSCQNGFTRTWILFESGNSVPVDLSLFSAPKENIRPIDAYVVMEVEGTVTFSARRAAGAVYEVVRNYNPDIGPVVAGFDFTAKFKVTGESGGLAFAVALAKRLLNKDPGPVAATGIVESSHNGGPIKKVRGIEAKLEAAGAVLPSGGWIFYPQENENEISVKLRNRLISKGLSLYPVSSVAQTIEILFANIPYKTNTPYKKSKTVQRLFSKKRMLMSFLFFLILLLASIGLVLWKDKQFTPDQSEIEDKQYENQEDIKVDELGKTISRENQVMKKDDAEIEEGVPKSTGIGKQDNSVMVNIFGKTRLNAEISNVLTMKLKNFFALPHHHLGPVENVFISGQVVVLRIEENWIEERQRFRSSMRVALRDFKYEDKNKKMERSDIEVTVYARGMVEDMVPLVAQELMNTMLSFLSSGLNDD